MRPATPATREPGRPWRTRARGWLGSLPGTAALLLAAAGTVPLAPVAWGPPARGAQPAATEPAASARPFPAIEAGMHTATIKGISVDRAGLWAVTASHDKTARIWNLATGQLERVLRVPVGEGNEGKLYAVALSPDGTLVALGGWTNPDGSNTSIYLFDRASGRLLQRFSGLPNVVHRLAFAADGRRLAAALGGANGIRVYGATGQAAPAQWVWQQVAADGDYGKASNSVEFDAAGRLLATSVDGELRLYGAGASGRLQPLVRRAAPGGKKPFSARFSPDGRRIAVGFDDSTAVAVLDGASLEPLAPADTSSITNGNFYGLAWSADGRHLLAAGRYNQGGSHPLVVWPAAGGAPQRLPLGMTDTVMDLRPLADGRLVFAGQDPAWGVLDPQLRRTAVFAGPPVLDHRSDAASSDSHAGYKAFRLAPDGRWMEFRAVSRGAEGPAARLVRFDLAQRRLLLPGAAAPGGLPPRSTGLPIQGWQNTTTLTLAGKPLPLKPGEKANSLAISANGNHFALGSEWAVRLLEADGRQRWRTSTPGVAWLVNLSADGRFVVAALSDGTIRWYHTSNGSQALALYLHPDLKRWILWTPEGFYDASPGGAELLGYHLNNGREQAGTFIRASQLAQRFLRPELIARRLAGDEASIAAAVAEVGDVRQTLRPSTLPPEIRLIGRPQRLPGGEVEITYELIDKGGGIGAVQTRLGENGPVIEGRANPPVAGINRRRIPLPSGKVRAQLVAFSRSGDASAPLRFELEGAPSSEPPALHLLAVGITAYSDGALRQGVRFAAADAEALEVTLRRPGLLAGARLGTVKRIPDGEASRARITAELEAMAKVVNSNDRFVLYLAGHGTAIDGEYYFLTQELSSGSDADVRRQALSGSQLRDLLQKIKASGTLLLFDTCSSGTYGSTAQQDLKASVRRFEQLDGRLMLAAAGDRRMALESPFGRRGIFTAVVIDGLLGKADRYGDDRVVKASELLGYVVETVPEITQREFGVRQEPYPSSVGNFPLTRSGAPAP